MSTVANRESHPHAWLAVVTVLAFALTACEEYPFGIGDPENDWVSLSILPASPRIPTGGTVDLTVRVLQRDGDVVEDIDHTVGWSSSDTGVATVDAGGVVQGVATGRATITASLHAVGNVVPEELTATASIEVTP